MSGSVTSLVVCSNSGPRIDAGSGDQPGPAAAGGLVPHVLQLLAELGGRWFHRGDGPSVTWEPDGLEAVQLHPLSSPEHGRAHYETVSIETLQWMFHYLHDTAATPSFDHGLHRAWESYRHVNRQFAHAVAARCTAAEPPPVVLVNDYHLMLVPGVLRDLGVSRSARVVYAHHVPWCEPAYFSILPAEIRTEILASLLSCEAISFHSAHWRDAFARCCERYLPARVVDHTVEYHDRRTRLVAVPFPLDSSAVEQLSTGPAWHRERERLDGILHGRRLLARADRLDLWKNQVRGFQAYAELLRRRPHLADEWCFVAVLAPTRYRSDRHRRYEAACRGAISEIGQRHGAGAVRGLISDEPETRTRALATLSRADAVLVNPTFDGFNLVAKEALLVGQNPTVLLSTTAGAYEHLAPGVHPIEPFDVSGTASALESVLGPAGHSPPAAAATLRESIRRDRAADWLDSLLDDEGDGHDPR